jgi:5-hydroxyisourate hydrolase
MSGITTHVLDTSLGRPVVGLEVELQLKAGSGWKALGTGLTDANGRCIALLGEQMLEVGVYRLLFRVAPYFQEHHVESFYSEIPIIFEVRDANAHYHVPLLISPFGYSTYRGS